ncbi:MAG: histidine phosphatase family protein [Mariprofundaceae bacterium]|nr:histidine phosphatase family protein [Mariprofundaceae bacterium]
MMGHVDLLRHGALCGGVRYRGRMEEDLNAEGWQQMEQRWQQLKPDSEVIISSPLSRCAIPAQKWAKEKGIACVIMPEFQEMNYGAWEGMSKAEIEKAFPNMLAQWRTDPSSMQIPDAESLHDFRLRVLSGWQKIITAHAHQHVLLLTHSGVFRLILSQILGAELAALRHFRVQYAAWARLEHKKGEKMMLQAYQQGLSK